MGRDGANKPWSNPLANCPGRLNTGSACLSRVVAKSAALRFHLLLKTALAPLLLLSKPHPLRWAAVWVPPAAAF